MVVSENLGRKIPGVDDVLSSREKEIYPTTSLDENCIECDFQTDVNFYVHFTQSYLALKLKMVKGRLYETYNSKEVKNEHKQKTKADESMEEEEDPPVPVATHVKKNIVHTMFSSVEVYTNNQQVYNSNRLHAHKSNFSHYFKRAISEHKVVLHCEGYDFEEYPNEIKEVPLSEPFYTRKMKTLSRPDGFMLYGKLGVDFISTSEMLYPSMKVRLRLIRPRLNFYMISDNPNASLRIVDCLLYTRRIALKDDYHQKRMGMFSYTPVEFNYFET